MKNLAKFLLFVLVVSAGISLLYDYRLKHGGLNLPSARTAGKILAGFNAERGFEGSRIARGVESRAARSCQQCDPVRCGMKTSKKIGMRREYGMDPFEFFFRNPRQFRSPNEQAMVQNSLGSGVIVSTEGHIITNNHVVDHVDEIEVQLSDGRTKKARLVGADAQRRSGCA